MCIRQITFQPQYGYDRARIGVYSNMRAKCLAPNTVHAVPISGELSLFSNQIAYHFYTGQVAQTNWTLANAVSEDGWQVPEKLGYGSRTGPTMSLGMQDRGLLRNTSPPFRVLRAAL